MGTLTVADLISRVESKTQSGTVAFANWPPQRKLDLVNDGIFETYKRIVGVMKWQHFVEVDDGIVPAGNSINMAAALSKPFYSILAFIRYPYGDGDDVNIRTIRDVHTRRALDEGWYEAGETLRSDSASVLAGPYRVAYNWKPLRFTLDQVASPSPIPDDWGDMPAVWAAKEAYADSGFSDKAGEQEGKWEKYDAKMQSEAAKKNPVTQTRILDKMGWSRRGTVFLGRNGWP